MQLRYLCKIVARLRDSEIMSVTNSSRFTHDDVFELSVASKNTGFVVETPRRYMTMLRPS